MTSRLWAKGSSGMVASIGSGEIRSWLAVPQLLDVLLNHPNLLHESPATAPLHLGQRFQVEAFVPRLPWLDARDGPWLVAHFSAAGLEWHAVIREAEAEAEAVTPGQKDLFNRWQKGTT